MRPPERRPGRWTPRTAPASLPKPTLNMTVLALSTTKSRGEGAPIKHGHFSIKRAHFQPGALRTDCGSLLDAGLAAALRACGARLVRLEINGQAYLTAASLGAILRHSGESLEELRCRHSWLKVAPNLSKDVAPPPIRSPERSPGKLGASGGIVRPHEPRPMPPSTYCCPHVPPQVIRDERELLDRTRLHSHQPRALYRAPVPDAALPRPFVRLGQQSGAS